MEETKINNVEINLFAQDFAQAITDDLNNDLYKRLNGSLRLVWGEEREFNASAHSELKPDGTPEHLIVLNYELVQGLYRDAEEFCNFAKNPDAHPGVKEFLSHFNLKESLPSCFTHDDCIKNMFIGSLTWIYFHELGHLLQEHGIVREASTSGESIDKTAIVECDSSLEKPLEGKAAAVSHATEFAADAYATHRCIVEQMRHCKDERFTKGDPSGESFLGLIYLLTCGLTCLFYRFDGGRLLVPEPVPRGSHPSPLSRLELACPKIWETLNHDFMREFLDYQDDKAALMDRVARAAYLSSFFVIIERLKLQEIPAYAIPRGIDKIPNMHYYFSEIVKTWDEIRPTIMSHQRTNEPLGMLSFSEFFRSFLKL